MRDATANIRPFELTDVDPVSQLKHELTPPEGGWAERFDWQFANNPMRQPGRPLGWVVEGEGGRILGSQMSMPHRFSVFGEELFAGMSMDTLLHPDLRGHGMGRRLFDTYFEDLRGGLAVTNSANAISEALWRKAGAQAIGDLHREYLFVFRSAALLDEVVRRRLPMVPGTRLLMRAIGRLCDLAPRLVLPSVPRTVHTEPVQALDSRLDDIWENYREQYPVTVVRDAAYRRWRYDEAPDPRPTLWLVSDTATGSRAFFGLQRKHVGLTEISSVELTDVFGASQDPLFVRNVLVSAVQVARQLDCHVLRIKGLHSRWRSQLRRIGCLSRALPSAPFLFRNMGSFDVALLDRFESWHLCAADGDLLLA